MNIKGPCRSIQPVVAACLVISLMAVPAWSADANTLARMAESALMRRAINQSINTGSTLLAERPQKVPAGAQIEVGFSPNPRDQALRLVLKIINAAHKTIEVAAYEMTSKPVADALIRASQRGVQVFVVADARVNQGGGYSKVATMSANGVHTRLDGLYPIMHNKFIVVDSTHVETGSYNYSYAAERKNAENVIVLWNNPALARLYAQRFNQLWAESPP